MYSSVHVNKLVHDLPNAINDKVNLNFEFCIPLFHVYKFLNVAFVFTPSSTVWVAVLVMATFTVSRPPRSTMPT